MVIIKQAYQLMFKFQQWTTIIFTDWDNSIIPKNKFSQADLEELEEFLLSDKTPDECMDISALDGFLTCLAIGPETVMPSKWLPEIWGESSNDEMVWDSMEETEHIIGLIMSFFNSIVQVFTKNPNSFEPLFYTKKVGLVAAIFVLFEFQLVIHSQFAVHQIMASLATLPVFYFCFRVSN